MNASVKILFVDGCNLNVRSFDASVMESVILCSDWPDYDLFMPLLYGGCTIDIPKTDIPDMFWGDQDTIQEELLEWLGRNIEYARRDKNGVLDGPIIHVRKMQIQGYKLSHKDKDVFVKGALRKLSSYKSDLSRYAIPFDMPSEKELMNIVTLQEPLPLLAQSRICIRRKLMERGNNLYRSVKELNQPRFVEEIILMENKHEVMKCVLRFGNLDFFYHIMKCNDEQSKMRDMERAKFVKAEKDEESDYTTDESEVLRVLPTMALTRSGTSIGNK